MVSDSVTDSTGIVRLCWINMKVNNSHTFRIFFAPQPCGKSSTSPKGLGTLYDKLIRYHRAIWVNMMSQNDIQRRVSTVNQTMEIK